MTDKDKTAQEPDDRSDWILGKVSEPTQRLRRVQTEIDALVSGAMTQLLDLMENRDEREYASTAIRRLEALLTQAQGKVDEALSLANQIANDVDRGILEPSREAE
jgi:hypothetical protein